MKAKTISKLALFDKDGTVTKTKSGTTFHQTPDDQEPLFDFGRLPRPEAIDDEGIVHCYNYGVITNQKGVSLGYKDAEFLRAEIDYLIHQLGFPADIILLCPDDGDSVWVAQVDAYKIDMFFDCLDPRYSDHFGIDPQLKGQFRKPNPGMLLSAENHYKWSHPWVGEEYKFDEIIFVGDQNSDEAACKAAREIDNRFRYISIENFIEGMKKG